MDFISNKSHTEAQLISSHMNALKQLMCKQQTAFIFVLEERKNSIQPNVRWKNRKDHTGLEKQKFTQRKHDYPNVCGVVSAACDNGICKLFNS